MDHTFPVVHIGFHKTGSTWLQSELFPRVVNARFVEPDVVNELIVAPHAHTFRPAVISEQFGEAFRLLVSSEELSGNIHVGGLNGAGTREYARRIQGLWPEADVVIVVREHVACVVASYKQYVAKGGTRSFRRYLSLGGDHHRRPRFSLDHFRFAAVVQLYRDLFGEDKVHVYQFADFRRGPEQFARRLCSDLGLEVSAWNEVRWGPVNRSLPSWMIGPRRVLNILSRDKVDPKYYLIHVPGAYEAIRKAFDVAASVPWLNRLDSILGVGGLPGGSAKLWDYFSEDREKLARMTQGEIDFRDGESSK